MANTQDSQQKIVEMFDNIAHSYDITNRVLSLGVDTRWRKEACKIALNLHKDSQKNENLSIADVACGTGDMILEWLKNTKNPAIKGIDPSVNMLKMAREKLPSEVELINGEAKNLALEADSIDILSIAYGLRNVVELDLALAEFKRVLRNGGVVVILEFTKKDSPNLLDKLALFYTTRILPYIGGLITKDYEAYKYLPDSINSFITLEVLESKLENLGLKMQFKKRYIGNLCSLIIAKKV